MNKKTEGNILFIDLETTGLPLYKSFGNYYPPNFLEKYECSRMIEIGYIIYSNREGILKENDSLIKPDNFIITNSRFHGITNEDCKKKGDSINNVLNQLEKDIINFNIKTIISHNIKFDINILLSEIYRYKFLKLFNKIAKLKLECTMLLGQYIMKVNKYPKLIELYKFLFNKSFPQKHRALDDVKCCFKCYIKMLKMD